jgi:outer membrane protein assembly factor BamB
MTTLTFSDGFLYFGTVCVSWTDSNYGYGVYRCVDASDGTVLWTHANPGKGYYWSGAVVFGGTVIFAGDDGILTSLNKTTGAVLDTLALGAPVRATAVLDGNHALLTSKDGRLHKITLQNDGTFGGGSSVLFAAESTSTPAVADGKAYVGGSAADYSGVLAVIDLASMQVTHIAQTAAPVQSSPLVSVGYGAQRYVYFTANAAPGGVYVLNASAAVPAVQTLFTPEEADRNYCLASVISGGDGTLYYTNDSGKLFAVGVKMLESESCWQRVFRWLQAAWDWVLHYLLFGWAWRK